MSDEASKFDEGMTARRLAALVPEEIRKLKMEAPIVVGNVRNSAMQVLADAIKTKNIERVLLDRPALLHALAQALAVLSFDESGVKTFGQHWRAIDFPDPPACNPFVK